MAPEDSLRSWISYVRDDELDRLSPGTDRWALADYARRWHASSGGKRGHRLLQQNIATYLLDDLLPKVDRMSSAHALEVRSPFLDTALADTALRLPPKLLYSGLQGKRVLRAALGGALPSEILNRRKHGFGLPLDRWFRDDLASYVEGMLLSADARLPHYAEPAVLAQIVHEHARGASRGHLLWALLTLEVFLRSRGW